MKRPPSPLLGRGASCSMLGRWQPYGVTTAVCWMRRRCSPSSLRPRLRRRASAPSTHRTSRRCRPPATSRRRSSRLRPPTSAPVREMNPMRLDSPPSTGITGGGGGGTWELSRYGRDAYLMSLKLRTGPSRPAQPARSGSRRPRRTRPQRCAERSATARRGTGRRPAPRPRRCLAGNTSLMPGSAGISGKETRFMPGSRVMFT